MISFGLGKLVLLVVSVQINGNVPSNRVCRGLTGVIVPIPYWSKEVISLRGQPVVKAKKTYIMKFNK